MGGCQEEDIVRLQHGWQQQWQGDDTKHSDQSSHPAAGVPALGHCHGTSE